MGRTASTVCLLRRQRLGVFAADRQSVCPIGGDDVGGVEEEAKNQHGCAHLLCTA